MANTDHVIDVQDLIAAKSVEEHAQAAEEYFAHLSNWDHQLAKPFSNFDEMPQLLVNLAVLIQGLQLCPGMTVLEFGAGTCWTARILTQLGCKVIAADVSASALRIGQELYARHPPFGDKPQPKFLLFNGRNLDLEDNSVERVICLDAFHHVPNARQVLMELGRVLQPGGIAAFSEPGPEHSQSAQSQYEMKTHGVIENDIDIKSIWAHAQDAGFTDLKLALFQITPTLVSMGEFEDFVRDGKSQKKFVAEAQQFLRGQRNFFLYKGKPRQKDSRYRHGLTAKVEVKPIAAVIAEGHPLKFKAVIRNTSDAVWLASNAGMGAVMLGCHVFKQDGTTFKESFHWQPLRTDNREVQPGEVVRLEFELPVLPLGSYRIDFDMVSNDVCWFAINGSEVASVNLQVVPV